MIIRKRHRQGGKTRLLVKWVARDSSRVIVVATAADAARVRRLPDLAPHQVVTIGEVVAGGARLQPGTLVAVDDIDRVFAMLLGVVPDIGTVTHDDIARA